jgi:hypothetical protein
MKSALVLIASLSMLIVAALQAPVSAGGSSSTPCSMGPQPATCTYTFNAQDLTQTFYTNNPCVDPPNGPPTGILTATYSEVFHETVNQAGDVWLTSTVTGDMSFIPYDPSRPSYAGHFVSWFGGSFNMNNSVLHDTSTTSLRGSDGSHISIHMADHTSISASGITLQFDNATTSC